MRILSNLNERIIDNLINDSDILNLIIQKLFEIEDREDSLIELYCIFKPFYYIHMVDDTLQLLTNIIKTNANDFKFLRYFTAKNIDILSDLAKHLIRNTDKQSKASVFENNEGM